MNRHGLKLLTLLLLLFWPISLIKSNSSDWTGIILGTLVYTASWMLHKRGFRHYWIIYIALPFIHSQYLLVPIFFILFHLCTSQSSLASRMIFLATTTLLSILFASQFFGTSIFSGDPLAFDSLIRRRSLIENTSLARIYENKLTIPSSKFQTNLFQMPDINNYFFSYHPRELGTTEPLQFPYLAVFLFC
jgi:hypothetical protein